MALRDDELDQTDPTRHRCGDPVDERQLGGLDAATPLGVDPLLTVDDLALLLRLSVKSVYKLVEEKRIPGVRRLGRRIRFYGPEVVAWMSGQESARPRRSR